MIIERIETLGFTGTEVARSIALATLAQNSDSVMKSPLIEGLLDRARREQKALVLEFSGNFCSACIRLERETIENPQVQKALENVIFCKIMVEKNRLAAHQFHIHAIPQLRFLSPEGEIVSEDAGVISVDRMLDHLRRLRGLKTEN